MPEFDATLRYSPIPGYPHYLACSDGTIWSCLVHGNRGVGRGSGGARVPDYSRWKQLKPSKERYFRVSIYDANRKIHFKSVHKLVILAFRGLPPIGMVCRHLNGDNYDCRIDNLVYGTHKENTNDKWGHGTMPFGEKHHNTKLSEADVVEIHRLGSAKTPRKQIAAKFGVSLGCIEKILYGQSWPHIKQRLSQAVLDS